MTIRKQWLVLHYPLLLLITVWYKLATMLFILLEEKWMEKYPTKVLFIRFAIIIQIDSLKNVVLTSDLKTCSVIIIFEF